MTNAPSGRTHEREDGRTNGQANERTNEQTKGTNERRDSLCNAITMALLR